MVEAYFFVKLIRDAFQIYVQAPDWTVEVKELDLGMDSEESGLSFLGARLILTTCNIYDRDQNAYPEHALSLGQRLLSVGGLGGVADGTSAPCYIEHLSINSSFGHARYQLSSYCVYEQVTRL